MPGDVNRNLGRSHNLLIPVCELGCAESGSNGSGRRDQGSGLATAKEVGARRLVLVLNQNQRSVNGALIDVK